MASRPKTPRDEARTWIGNEIETAKRGLEELSTEISRHEAELVALEHRLETTRIYLDHMQRTLAALDAEEIVVAGSVHVVCNDGA